MGGSRAGGSFPAYSQLTPLRALLLLGLVLGLRAGWHHCTPIPPSLLSTHSHSSPESSPKPPPLLWAHLGLC